MKYVRTIYNLALDFQISYKIKLKKFLLFPFCFLPKEVIDISFRTLLTFLKPQRKKG